MDDMTKQILTTAAGSVVRHAMTTAAGALVTDGLVQAGDSDSFVKIGSGILMGLGALGLSWWNKSGQAQVAAMLKKMTAKTSTTAAVATAQALPTGAAVTKALVLFAVLLSSLVLAMPAHAQLAVTGNVAKDLATDRANIAKHAASTATSAATSTADDVLAALAKPFQDLATFIGNDIDAAVALSTAIPALQDGNGQQCWMGMQQFAAVVNAHPVPLTLKVATDLEALRLSMMAANNLCANPHCTQVFADLSNGVQQLAVGIGSAIPVPSLNAVCSKVPQIAVVASVPVPATPVPAAAKP